MKKILFISAIDFKEKSIQVIAKTPEAYVRHGWQVDYVVARDASESGDYYYENEITPEGVSVHRVYWPLSGLRKTRNNKLWSPINKLASWIAIIRLALRARALLRQRDYNIVYGYEVHGVLAAKLAMWGLPKRLPFVTRFQGTFLGLIASRGDWFALMRKWDHLLALRSTSDLTIMTNDGTQGDQALKRFRKPFVPENVRFWTNGVERNPFSKDTRSWPPNPVNFLTISRLISWKRVDRAIRIFERFARSSSIPCQLEIVGEGPERVKLEGLAIELGIKDKVKFVGALAHHEAMKRLANTDFFLSTYSGSNVGNPLLEALRAETIILTLDNGDTALWITHMENGLIYAPDKDFIEQAASDLESILADRERIEYLRDGVRKTAAEALWTWEERLNTEVAEVEALLEKYRSDANHGFLAEAE